MVVVMASMSTSPPSRSLPADRRTQLAEVLIRITADRGLEAVTIREVASAAGLSIGAVQHHFATKNEMLAFAFQHVIDRTRQRIESLIPTGHVLDDVSAVLSELLPLDGPRRDEARVYVAFAARAGVTPELQAIQRALLTEIRHELEQTLGPHRSTDAVLLMALVDGMVLHETSAPGSIGSTQMTRTLRAAARLLLTGVPTTTGRHDTRTTAPGPNPDPQVVIRRAPPRRR